VRRLQHGVKATVISFDNVREILIPPGIDKISNIIREQYSALNRWHEKAMARKEELATAGRRVSRGKELKEAAEADAEYRRRIEQARRRLRHLVREVERYVSGETESIRAYVG